MEPGLAVTAALKLAFNFVGRKVLDSGYKKLTEKSDEEYALLTALQTLPKERRKVGRLAIQDWLESSDWRKGIVLRQLKQEGGLTPALLGQFEQRSHGLEVQDRPRIVAETFLSAYWILYLKERGAQVMLNEGKVTHDLIRDVQHDVQQGFSQLLARHDETEQLVLDSTQQLVQVVQQLVARVETGGESASQVHLTGTPLPPEDPYTHKLQRIDYSLEDQALAATERRLKALALDVEEMSDPARAKYLRLWGNLENNRGHQAEAAKHYMAAFEYDSNSAGGLTLRGYAALLTDQPESALVYLDRALKKQRRSDALALKVYALDELARYDDIEALRGQEKPPGDVEFALALAQVAMNQGQFEVASTDLQPLLETEHAQDVRVKMALARIRIMPIDLELRRAPRIMMEIPALLEHHPEIAHALTLVNEVLAEASGSAPALWEQAANLKQVILFWQNRFPELLVLTQADLKADPDDVLSLRHAALAYMALNRPDDAWQMFTRIPEAERDVEVRTLGASAAEQTGRNQEAADLLDTVLRENLSARARENALLMAARVFLALGRPLEAQEMLRHEANDSAVIWLARAEVEEALEDHERTSAAFQQAVDLADGERAVRLRLQYAAYLRGLGQLNPAVEIVRPVIGETRDSETLLWMGALLWQAGALPDAQRIVEALEAQQDNSFEAHDLGAAVYAELERWDMAAAQDAYLLETHPTDGRVLWNAAIVRSKLGDREETLNLLRRFVARPDVTGSELMGAANFASQLAPGPEALDWAYQARRKDYSDPARHVDYLGIANRCPHDYDLAEVQPESAVLLRNSHDDTERWMVLTADEAPSRSQGEFALDSREAQLLLGQTLGDTVKLREGEGGTYEVRAVITKYANAERALFQDFHQMFPADERMVMIRVLDPKPDAESGLPQEWQKLKEVAEKTAQQRVEAGQVIARNQYAHVLNATLSLESATTFWLGVLRHKGTFLSYLGDKTDAQASDAALSAQAWVLDVSALLSLAITDQLDLLLLAGLPLQVTDQTAQELEALAGQHEPVSRALHFVRTHAAVMTAPLDTDRLDRLFPAETASALVLAAAQTLPLLTEDAGLRHSNRAGFYGPVLNSFGVVDVLLALVRAGKLDQPALETQLLPLLLAGRLLLPLSRGLLQRAVLHDAGQVGHGLEAVLRMALHPNLTIQYQALVAGELLKLLWTQPDLGGRRQAVVRQLVAGLSAFQDRTPRFKELYRVTQSLFHLLPQQAREVTAELQKAHATWESA